MLTFLTVSIADKKIQIGSEELVNAIDGIEKFNDSNIVKIRAHIFGKQGFSLLHAAIVYERPDLVTRLLALGADPNARSDVGSAAAFAMYRAERERFAKTKLDIEALSVECNDKLSCLDAMAEELKMHAKFQQQLESISDHDSVASPNPLTSSVSTAQHKSLQKVPGNNSQAQARVLKRKANELDNSCETGSKGQALPRGMQAFLESISEKAEQWIEMTQVVSAFYAKYGEMDKDHFEATHWRALEDGLVEWGRRGLQSQIIPVSYREENTYDLSSQRFLRLTSRGQAIVAEGYSTSDLDHHVRQPTVDVLPSVTDNWFVVKGQRGKPCKFFRNAMECQCMHGARCLHPHIQPRLGNQFNRENMRIPSLILSEPNIAFCRQPDAASGKDWFTAVYRDPVSNIYFRAEGGLTGRKNAQGIWWYPTDVEAKKAVEFVYAARNVCSGVNKMSK